ncbi:MucBP domain-containing protein [Ligilactobacillus salivarius]|uniref:MucBP domain-containing protein n=1 Tax=Ligilactobacillus salivarius TaxID=1624 RepID=UPI001EE149F2|nr:MucBP domain-containing protein [Ligilactobacillus salivarius]
MYMQVCMGYAKEKELVKDKDYKIVKSGVMPHAYVVDLIGDYATTSSPIVVEYSGTVPAKNGERAVADQATTDVFVAYYEGDIVRSNERYTGPFSANWAEGVINVNNSSVTSSSQNVLGSVSVVHIDATTGKLLKPEAYVLEKDGTPLHNVEQGTKYKTTSETFSGYKFTTMGYDSAPAEGTVKEGHQRVIYLYVPEVKQKGNVDVTYVTEDGKVLEPTKYVVKDGKVGDDYTTEKNKFDGYKFKRMGEFSADAIGKVEEGTKHVVYVYAKTGNVDVKYVDTEGNVLPGGEVTPVKTNEEVGTEYGTTQKTFDGYHFVKMDVKSAPATGVVTAKDQHVIYVYEKDSETPTPEKKKGSVDVTYVAEDGKVLEPTKYVVKDGKVGDDYTTEKNKFDGYKFKRMGEFSADAIGKVEEGTKHVVYVYAKTGNVDVKYVDTEGNVLPGGEVTPVKTNEEVGTEYGTTQKTFDGYHFVKMDVKSAPATGVVTAKDQHVIYVYEKDSETPTPEKKKGSVDVKYVTTDGKVLEDVTKVKDNVPVGEAYTTEEKSFDGYHFVGMDKTSDSANGKVTEGDKHIVYVYEKDPEVPTTPVEKKGSVYVKYVDENGNELPGGEKITVVKDGKVGSYYFTTEKDFDGYTFSHMAEGSSDPTGKVVEGDQQVVYVYTKNNTPQPEPNKPEVPTTPETPAVPQEEKTTTDTPVKTSTSKVNAEKVTVNKATVLPQTGDKKENNSSVMGLVSLGLAGLLGLGIKRKEEKDNH